MPAPEPATPTVAAPAPMNLAAESMSLWMAVVCTLRANNALNMGAENGITDLALVTCIGDCELWLNVLKGRANIMPRESIIKRAGESEAQYVKAILLSIQ